MTDSVDAILLLGRCLAFRHDGGATAALRAELLGTPSAWETLTEEAIALGLTMALEQQLRGRGLLVSELLPEGSGLVGPDSKLRQYAAHFRARRAVLASHLRAILARLNAAEIEPIVIKGAQSLLTGQPEWRDLRDIDLLVVASEATAAQAGLIAMGYRPADDQSQRPNRHHLAPLLRDDLPGFVEIHRRGGNRYADALMPTGELLASSIPHSRDGLSFRLLPTPLYVLYAIVHHHVGHSADARGNVNVKGLYEFAWSWHHMSIAERSALATRADRHPRLHAALEFWIAAAADLFKMPVERPFEIAPDAEARWSRVLSRLGKPPPWYKYPGYADEIGMASAEERLRRAPGGARAAGRALWRVRVLTSLLPKLTA